MEAANLGAYLSTQPESAIDDAINLFRATSDKNSDPTVCHYTSHAIYTQAAFNVLHRFPNGSPSLGIPTWFYGHEPPNTFATAVAKFFSNAIREDVLLNLANSGTVFTEGAAGLREEIFEKASQNHFGSFCYVGPMVFLGTAAFGPTGLYQLVYNFASPAFPTVGSYRDVLTLTDSVPETVSFLKSHPTRQISNPEAGCP